VTNGERANRLLREASQIAGQMARALDDEAWNLATRRAQEALELTIKALLNAMSVEYPRTHNPAPIFAQAVRERGIGVDSSVLDSLAVLSRELANLRGPAFCQETVVTDAQARDWVQRVERVLQVGEDLRRRPQAVGSARRLGDRRT
jgi:HEPN domain-containing protein